MAERNKQLREYVDVAKNKRVLEKTKGDFIGDAL
jgi:hypothetical protein